MAAPYSVMTGEFLSALGLTCADVTDLLITHLHHDHMINWPMFPDATIHAPRAEMDWALALPDGHESVAETSVRALAACPRLKLFELRRPVAEITADDDAHQQQDQRNRLGQRWPAARILGVEEFELLE